MNPIRDCETTTPASKQADAASIAAIRKAGPAGSLDRAAPFRHADRASTTATGNVIILKGGKAK